MATAFAVYSATDNSLNFYKRDTVPSAGSTFEGKVATAVYSNIETSQYASYNNVPWYSDGNCYQVTNVTIVDTITPISTAYWFHDFGNMNSCDVNNLDTSKVTNMANMFFYSRSLTFLNVSHFKTNNVTNMTNMFNYCSSSVLDVSNFDTSKVTDMSYMFQDCANITSLDLSNFNTSKVTNMDCMFISCSSLNTIYVSEHWNTNAVTSSNYMFSGCTELTGNLAYNSNYVDKTYAKYDGGYLVYRPTYYHQDFLVKGGIFYDTGAAIKEKLGSKNGIKVDTFPNVIKSIKTSKDLPRAEEVAF